MSYIYSDIYTKSFRKTFAMTKSNLEVTNIYRQLFIKYIYIDNLNRKKYLQTTGQKKKSVIVSTQLVRIITKYDEVL